MNQDQEHLNLLAIFHYVVAGVAALFAVFPGFYVAFGLAIILQPGIFSGSHQTPPPAFMGWMMIVMGSVMILFGLTFATLILCAGRSLARRKRHTFCLVVAALGCLFMPFGTVLGIFTIIVLQRPSVKQLFTGTPAPTAP